MLELFPLKTPIDRSDEPWLVRLDEDDADEIFNALSSNTARKMMAALYDEPHTSSELAEIADTSLQNIRYHLNKMEDAGLVETTDTWYSERGGEMAVYTPTKDPLIIAAGRSERTEGIRAALKRLVGAIGALILGSFLVNAYLGPNGRFGLSGGRVAPPTPRTTTMNGKTPGVGRRTLIGMPTRHPQGSINLPPGLVFFAGGLFVILIIGLWLLYRK